MDLRVADVIEFNSASFFNGAVQTDWYYIPEKRKAVAESYLFHGPSSYGVSQKDVGGTQHKLLDTASFTKVLMQRLYTEEQTNPFLMTIAGYGTGKSHLAVCLGALFGGPDELRNSVIRNLKTADAAIGAEAAEIIQKPNLIVALNGMNNFNLDAEVLRCVRQSLQEANVDDAPLRQLTKSYDIARTFVIRNFDSQRQAFEQEAGQRGISRTSDGLKRYLLDHIEQNAVLETVNAVYHGVTGDVIRWDRGMSAGDVLALAAREFCGAGKPFQKVLVLFDEFGRFIEFTAANPVVAGEAAMQQIFEAVQNGTGKIVFVGFIQSELNAYLSRIDKTGNIIRYVGRYENSDKYYLSTNFETILASLFHKGDAQAFEDYVGRLLNQYSSFYERMRAALQRWSPSTVTKSVWTVPEMYQRVILRGCYPMHPVTVWLLANSSSWMQQRSTVAFAAEMFDAIRTRNLPGNWLPWVRPIDIVDSGIFSEMLNSEEKGLVSSQDCMLYRDIMTKIGSKLQEDESAVLKAILLVNIGRFRFHDRADAVLGLRFCCNLEEEKVCSVLKQLEELHGVVTFDSQTSTFDLTADSSGYNDFRRAYARYAAGFTVQTADCIGRLTDILELTTNISTSFGQQNHISTVEWCFSQEIEDAKTVSASQITQRLARLEFSLTGEAPRGLLLYLYGGEKTDIDRISEIYRMSGLDKKPILLVWLDDPEGELLTHVKVLKVMGRFSKTDADRFFSSIQAQERAKKAKIQTKFREMVNARQILTGKGLEHHKDRLSVLCGRKFGEIFPAAAPFAFDGFEKASTAQARKALISISKRLFDRSICNVQIYQGLTVEEKNRVRSCLSTDTNVPGSWKVFTPQCRLTEPGNERIAAMYADVVAQTSVPGRKTFQNVFWKFLQPPYGMNLNSLTLFFMYCVAQMGSSVLWYYDGKKLNAAHISEAVFLKDKINRMALLQISIEKNPNAGRDVVAEVCEKVLCCTASSQCNSLRKELDRILEQEGPTKENQYVVAEAKAMLDHGDRVQRELGKNLDRLEQMLTEAKKGYKIHAFVLEAFKTPLSPQGKVYPDLPFVYEDWYLTRLEKVRSGVDTLLKSSFPAKLAALSPKITELDSFRVRYQKVAKILRDNGYKDYAENTEKRIKEIEENLLTREKYKSTLTELDRLQAQCSKVTDYGVQTLLSLQGQLEGLQDHVKSATDMVVEVQKEVLGKIQASIQLIVDREEQIIEHLNSAVAQAEQAQSQQELRQAQRELELLAGKELPEKDEKRRQDTLQELQKVMKLIQSLPASIDALKAYQVPDLKVGEAAVRTEQALLLRKLQKQQNNWGRDYLSDAECRLPSMDADTCIRWLRQTERIPDYLDGETVRRYDALKTKVQDKLGECRVQGVVAMFQQLNEQERKNCLRVLMSIQ